MEKRTDSPYPRRDRPVLAVVGVLLVALDACSSLRNDREHDWRWYQAEFRKLVGREVRRRQGEDGPRRHAADLGALAEPRRPLRHLPPGDVAGRASRPPTNPFRTHPRRSSRATRPRPSAAPSCHGGQGWAVDAEPAHGPVAHWEEPLLGKGMGEAYSLVDNKAALMQMNCNVCHRYDRETKGADVHQPRARSWSSRRAAAPAT